MNQTAPKLPEVEEHDLASKYPVRLPVWWGIYGEKNNEFKDMKGVTGKNVMIRHMKIYSKGGIIRNFYGLLEKILQKIMRAPNVLRRPLYEMNSLLWELSDGHRTFSEICNILDQTYQEDIAPVQERTAMSIKKFESLGMMTISDTEFDGRWNTNSGFDITGKLPEPDPMLKLEWDGE